MDKKTVKELLTDEDGPVVHQVAKLVLGAVAGYFAGVLVKNVYDIVLEKVSSNDDEDITKDK